MAPKTTDAGPMTLERLRAATGVEDPYDACTAYLERAGSAAELAQFGLDIRPVTGSALSNEQIGDLRNFYSSLRVTLQNVIKMREIDGEEVTLTEPARYIRTANGPSFYLTGLRADGRRFECWAPKHRVARWLEGLKVSDYPVRVVFQLKPHPKDPGKTLWDYTELAPPREKENGSGVPF